MLARPLADDVRVHRVSVPALERVFEARADETLQAAAARAGLRIVAACGGRGRCNACLVRLHAGRVERLAGVAPAADAAGGDQPWLRACRARAASDLAIELAPRSLAPVAFTSTGEAGSEPLSCDPADRSPIAHGPASAGAPRLGLAVDLGTTKVAAFLVDLAAGRRLAALGLENPQAAWGADLVSRLDHARRGAAAAAELQRAAVGVVGALARDLARAVGAEPGDIAEAVVCGNTAMQQLFAGLPVDSLARAPFVAATDEPLELSAADLGLPIAPGATLHLAPPIGGHVGGDHVAALLATEPQWSGGGTTLLVDIGTNTEITLVHAGRLLSASCPSGPALEGGHIGSGMQAAEGAIEGVALGAGRRLDLKVIGGTAPLGLCGSGVVAALAAFLEAGWVDRRGRIAAHAPGCGPASARAIVLAEGRDGLPPVVFGQDDVRAVQLAKSAIRSGAQMLAREAGIGEDRIDRILVAGAFGARLDLAGAQAIGLLPPVALAHCLQVGNAAGLGVQQMLASRTNRQRATQLARRCRHVALGTLAGFQDTFLRNLGFQELP